MNRKALLISVAFAALAAAAPAMAKGSLYTLPMVSGSTETIAFGVANNGTITGFWIDSSGIENGFVGPDDGSNYTVWGDESGGGMQARGLNRKGYVTGIDNVGSGQPTSYIPFVRSPDGTITDVTKNGVTLNYLVQGINRGGFFTGSYENASAKIIGYIGKNGKYKSKITLPGITTTAVAGRGLNDNGDIAGWYEDSGGVQHGFILSGGVVTTVDNPNGATNLEGINNTGEASGLYTDSSGNRHGFTYNISAGTFHELTVPGSTAVEVWGLNDKGVVAIDGSNSSGGYTGYLWCPRAADCPGGNVKVSPPAHLLHAPRTPLTAP